MKNVLLVIAGVLLVLLAGFYYYSIRISKPKAPSLQNYVPTDAVLIYENKKPSYAPKQTPDLASWIRKKLKQDSIFISPLRSREVQLSVHITGKEDFGILYYLMDSSILQDASFKKLLGPGKTKRRNFEGHSIVDLPSAGHGILSYTTIDEMIFFSRQPLLIEDVIRTQNEEENGFRKKNDALFHLMPADAGQGKLYANIGTLTKFSGILFSEDMKNDLFRNLGSTIIADAKIEDLTLTLNGFATDSAASSPSFLSLFNDQRPAASDIQKMVSNRSLFFVHYGIPDYKLWNKKRSGYKTPHTTSSAVPANEFYECLGDESGICYMAGSAGQTDDVLLIEIKKEKSDKFQSMLTAESPVENYSNYPIYTAISPELIHDMLWPLPSGAPAAFFTRHGTYFIFAPNADVLKAFINDIEEDNMWGKSAEWNAFFNSVSLETNLSVEFNGSLLMPWLLNKLNPRWDSLSGARDWTGLQKGSLQFSRLNHSYYFSGVLQFDSHKKQSAKTEGTPAEPRISFPENITHVSLVRNHTTNAPELIVQTADKNLILMDMDFKVLFKLPLKDAIKGRVYQIDYLKNRKLQYLFLAGRSLYLIDRLGNDIKGYPQVVETPAEADLLSVFDYDNTRNYRFLLADQKGNLQMVDKDGKLLEGWNSKTGQTRLFTAPRAIRAGGKDYIITVDTQGTIQCFNRRGEPAKGFPVTAGIRPQGDWFFEKAQSGKEDLLTVVGSDGSKIQISLKGKIVNKESYVRSAPDSKFALMVSSTSDDYAVSRTDKGKIAVLGRTGDLVFEKENPGSDMLETSFISPAPGEKIFCFRDAQQDFVHLFDAQGKAVFNRPLESSRAPVMVRRKDGLKVFAVFNHDLSRITP